MSTSSPVIKIVKDENLLSFHNAIQSYIRYGSNSLFTDDNIIRDSSVNSQLLDKYYLGATGVSRDDEEVSYVFTEFFIDIFSGFKFIRDTTDLLLSDYIDVRNYKIKYESYFGDHYNLFARISLLNFNDEVLAINNIQINAFGDKQERDKILNGKILMHTFKSSKIHEAFIDLLSEALQNQRGLSYKSNKEIVYVKDDRLGIKGAYDESIKNDSSTVKGKTFVITGKLSSPRDQIHHEIVDNGGFISNNVSSKIDYLITGSATGSKLTKARRLGIPIINETQLRAMY